MSDSCVLITKRQLGLFVRCSKAQDFGAISVYLQKMCERYGNYENDQTALQWLLPTTPSVVVDRVPGRVLALACQ